MTELQAEVVLALAESNLKISRAAEKMYRHRNSIVFHIEQIKQTTGKDPLNFYDMQDLTEKAKRVLEGEMATVRYKLDRNAIASLVAEKYGISPAVVTVTTEQVWIGHGPGEHVVHVPVAYFTKKE